MKLHEITDVIAPDLEWVERELEGNIGSLVPLVHEISKYILGSGGKRLRPSVLLLSSGACGLKNGVERIHSAVAIELIHTATLLHDDVVDDAIIRRGKKASNVIWGSKPSVLVGDFMLARALALISSCGNLEIIKTITDAASKLAEGQVFEVMVAKNMIEVSEEICFDIIENKTASLIESCGKVGAILAGANEETKETLGSYGFNLGIAFQLTDDALDYSATEKEFGKTIGQDLIEGKMTLPLIYALREASTREKAKALEILRNDDFRDEGFKFIMDIVEKYKGVQQTKRLAKGFANKAKDAISSLPENECKRSLDLLADYVAERRK
ncbi:MAG TPA: polyprenyl synthetase family protein [Thermodesulfobacteriota bacterium]|nr:polyprenyl synthetase family protein [Thermodesulfobacteriota bacterium]